MRFLMMKRKVKSKMTNTELLREKINASGYKLQFVAEKCGLTYFGLMKKVNNETDIVNIGLHFFLKNVRPYAASCSEA